MRSARGQKVRENLGHCDRDPLALLTFTSKQHHPTHRTRETTERQNHTTPRQPSWALPIYSFTGRKLKTIIQRRARGTPALHCTPLLQSRSLVLIARVRLLVLDRNTPNRKLMRTYGRCTDSLRSRSSIQDSSTRDDGIHTHSACGTSKRGQIQMWNSPYIESN